MSFTADEILEEFVEAAILGRHTKRLRVGDAVRATQRLDPTHPVLVPYPVVRTPCPGCGGTIERRMGTRDVFHVGGDRDCPAELERKSQAGKRSRRRAASLEA